MRFDILSGVVDLLISPFQESILKQAQEKKLIEIHLHDLRDYTHDKHRKIDDVPYGGESGMVLKPEPIFECIEKLQSERAYNEIIYLTADGETFTQKMANELSMKKNLLLLCGHYKGIDERVRARLITKEISIGDYVLTGGELAAAVVVDAVTRLIPGVINDAQALLSDSFQDGLLGAPSYTRPAEYRSMTVPDVLRSGNHRDIERWQQLQRMTKTEQRRNDLLKKFTHNLE
jgi:tRNA (guanine37-N1)-methyltransferase